jgi:hypothetical protein
MVAIARAELGDSEAAARRTLIDQIAVAVGQRWAERWRAELRQEGRRAAGGWPGTLREARGAIERALGQDARMRSLPAITADERETAARATNASARTAWLHAAEPDDE